MTSERLSERTRPSKRPDLAPLPATPQTVASTSMESEDEFMSGMSSEVDMAAGDSDGSFGEGECLETKPRLMRRLRARAGSAMLRRHVCRALTRPAVP